MRVWQRQTRQARQRLAWLTTSTRKSSIYDCQSEANEVSARGDRRVASQRLEKDNPLIHFGEYEKIYAWIYLQSLVCPSWFIFGTYSFVPAYSKSVLGGVYPEFSNLPVIICHSKFPINVFKGFKLLNVMCLKPCAWLLIIMLFLIEGPHHKFSFDIPNITPASHRCSCLLCNRMRWHVL